MIAKLIAKLRSLADRGLPQRLRDGRRGEELAYRYLRANGYKVVARNYRSRSGRPEEFVGGEKRGHLIRAAHNYARRAKVDPARLRYDVVSVVLEPAPQIELYKDVYSERRERERFHR
jgi:Holliday junction resolvase-like predicted endonuclease